MGWRCGLVDTPNPDHNRRAHRVVLTVSGTVSGVARPWQVLLIGGASGSGKTSVSYRVADHFKVGIIEVDDFQIILERMTTTRSTCPLMRSSSVL